MESGGNLMPLPQVARKVNLSPSHLSRLFKKQVQASPVQYRNAFRMQRAKAMLEGSFLSVKQVMAACGFNDRSYFSREFKKRYGLAPSLYRKATESRD